MTTIYVSTHLVGLPKWIVCKRRCSKPTAARTTDHQCPENPLLQPLSENVRTTANFEKPLAKPSFVAMQKVVGMGS